MADIFDRFLPKNGSVTGIFSNSSNMSNKIGSISKSNEFTAVMRMYQTMIDKS